MKSTLFHVPTLQQQDCDVNFKNKYAYNKHETFKISKCIDFTLSDIINTIL